MQRVRSIHVENPEPLTISSFDIVYFLEESGLQDKHIPIHAVPYYRIIVDGMDFPFLINAYTNRPQS
jgi:hypothetical protein